MKKLILAIAIISTDRTLADLLDKVQASSPSQFALNVFKSASQVPTATSLIIDTLSDSIAAVSHFEKYTGKYVLVSSNAELIHSLTENQPIIPHDIWRPDDSPAVLQLRFLNIIKQLDTQHRYYIASTLIDTTINSLPDLIWIKDVEGIHLKVNDAFARTVNKTKDNIEGYDHFHIWDINREEYANSDYVCVDTDLEVIKNRKSGVFDEKVATLHGLRQFKTYKAPIADESGSIIATVGIAQDVTEIRNMTAMFDLTINNMPFSIMIKNMDGEIIHLNTRFTEMFSCNQADYLHSCCDIEQIMMQQGIEFENDYGQQKIHMLKDGQNIILKIKIFPIKDYFDCTMGYFYMYYDITSTQLHENQLRKYAYTDSLTSLYTRRYLYEYLEQMEPQLCYFILIDIDNFKFINDTYGHNYGDDVLIGISRLVQDYFAEEICVRLGGDELFIMLTKIQSEEELTKRLDAFFKNVAEFSANLPQAGNISLSAGITSGQCSNLNELHKFITECDHALYHVKNAGKNAYKIHKVLPACV